jgi:UDP-2,3-diacylglucosamine pyrophosphatase LpxH
MPDLKIKIPDSLHFSYKSAFLLERDLRDLNVIIFSDHHRGTGDRADDYRFAEDTYKKALSHYKENRATLVLLGDVEEFWENAPEAVMKHYREVTDHELSFLKHHGYLRIYGNHDSDWKNDKFSAKHLKAGVPVYESVKVRIMDGDIPLGFIYLLHGHQGSFFSDSHARFSKFFVRYFWRFFQRIFNKPLSTAATSTSMRSKHDRFYYQWARNHKDSLVVITGHSHEPVFNGLTYADRLLVDHAELTNKEDLAILTEAEAVKLKEVRARLAALKKHDSTLLNPSGYAIPCYYNTGCCSYADGEITGIEIMDGEIRLIKWNHSGERKVIQAEGLRRVMSLRRVRGE